MVRTQYKEFNLRAEFIGGKNWRWDLTNTNYHHIYIVNSKTGHYTYFEFWESISKGKVSTEEDLLNAFDCFLTDALEVCDSTYEEFCYNLGYDIDSRESKVTYRLCNKAYDKFQRVFEGYDIYEFYDEFREYRESA